MNASLRDPNLQLPDGQEYSEVVALLARGIARIFSSASTTRPWQPHNPLQGKACFDRVSRRDVLGSGARSVIAPGAKSELPSLATDIPMTILARQLFDLARETELRVAALYDDLTAHVTPGSDESAFFQHLATEERIHAAWVDEIEGALAEEFSFPDLSEEDFKTILSTIEDVHDEALNKDLAICDTLEIILHLEESIAEEFYHYFPDDLPDQASALVDRMIRSSRAHADRIAKFREHCMDIGQGGVHTEQAPPD